MSIARLQQAISLTVVSLAAAWVAWCWGRGEPFGALWAVLILVPHAPVLAFETAWAASAARRPAARAPLGQREAVQPYPGLGTWVSSWAQEVLASLRVFGWQQPWRHGALPDFIPPGVQGRRGVLMVHGFVCNRGFWNPWMRRLRAAGVPHAAVTMGPPFADIALQSASISAAHERLLAATGQPPLLVGHSMGGLLIRSWLSRQAPQEALQQDIITIGSPHHGTALAQFAHSEAAVQMQLLSDFLQQLAATETPELRARFTCYWSLCDNIVFPANTATLPGADNRAVPGRPHVGLAYAPVILDDVMRRCAERPADHAG